MSANPLDKDFLYGRYDQADERRNEDYHKLGMKSAYKALDIRQDEDVNITAPKTTTITNNGLGLWAILGIIGAVLLALALGVLAAWFFLKPSAAKEPAYDSVTEELQADGTWKLVERVPWKGR